MCSSIGSECHNHWGFSGNKGRGDRPAQCLHCLNWSPPPEDKTRSAERLDLRCTSPPPSALSKPRSTERFDLPGLSPPPLPSARRRSAESLDERGRCSRAERRRVCALGLPPPTFFLSFPLPPPPALRCQQGRLPGALRRPQVVNTYSVGKYKSICELKVCLPSSSAT